MLKPFLLPENFLTTFSIADYQCVICKGILYEPVIDLCGHLFCKTCLSHHMTSSTTCPLSSLSLPTQLTIVPLIEKIINSQNIKCSNHKNDCKWIGYVSQLQAHLNEECLYELITCHFPDCNLKTLRESLEDHMSVCDYRIIRCIYCQISLPFHQIKEHYTVCPKKLIDCPQKCGLSVKRDEIDLHIEISCKNTLMKCPFHTVGCETKLIIESLKVHLEDCYVYHLDLVYDEHLESLKKDIMHFTEIDAKIERIKKQPVLIDYTIAKNVSLGFIGRKRGYPKNQRFFDIPSLPKEIIVIDKKIKYESSYRTGHKYVFMNMFNRMKGDEEDEPIDEYKWSIKLVTMTNWIAFGLCDKKKVIHNKMVFYITGNIGYDHGSFAVSSNGYLWNANSVCENNTRGGLFTIDKDDIIDLSYFPKLNELHFEINSYYGKLTNVFAKNPLDTLIPCVIFLNDGDQVELLPV